LALLGYGVPVGSQFYVVGVALPWSRSLRVRWS